MGSGGACIALERYWELKSMAERITQAEMRWKAFAEAYMANGFQAAAAARAAGYDEESVKGNVAATLLRRPEVLRHIRAISNRVAKKYEITRDFVFEGLEDALVMAQENNDPSAMTKALSEMAKLAGFMVDRQETVLSWKEVIDEARKRETSTEELLK
jgi:phage terminase small subunit